MEKQHVHILIVDDEQNVLDTLGDYLRELGHDVLLAASGEDALRLPALQNTEVALIDIHLKGKLNGHDLIARLNEALPDAAMILMSGRGEIDDLIVAFEQHVFTFLNKPFKSLREIDLLVRRAAESKRNEIAAREYTKSLEIDKSELERQVQDRTARLERVRNIVAHLFAVSSRLGLIEPLDSLLNYVCQSIVDAGAFRRAVLLLADERFVVRHLGAAEAEGDPDFLLRQVRLRRDQPLRPFDFGRDEQRIGSGFYTRSTKPLAGGAADDETLWILGDQLTVPLRRQDGTIFGYLSVDEPQDGARPSEEIIQYIDVLLNHSSLHVEAQQIRQALRQRADEMEKRVHERTAELRQSQEKFSRLVNLTTDIVYVTDADGKIVYLNDAFMTTLGYVRENYIGNSLASVLSELVTDDPANRTEIGNLIGEEDSTALHRIEVLTRQGDKRILEINRTVLRQGGEFTGTQGIVRDVTEHRALLKRVMSSERLAATGRLAAGVAHEINNPLQAITSLLGSVRSNSDNPKFVEQVDRIAEGIDRIRTIVRGMLDLHRVQSTAAVPVDMNAIVQKVIALTSKQLNSGSVDVSLALQENLPAIKGSPSDLQQVVLNLVLNSSEAMPEGGELTLQTESESGLVRVHIIDTGVGIRKEDRERIFEPFFSNRSGGGGVGLGLYLCKNTVEIHQGSIQVESSPGKGTRFTLTFPVAE